MANPRNLTTMGPSGTSMVIPRGPSKQRTHHHCCQRQHISIVASVSYPPVHEPQPHKKLYFSSFLPFFPEAASVLPYTFPFNKPPTWDLLHCVIRLEFTVSFHQWCRDSDSLSWCTCTRQCGVNPQAGTLSWQVRLLHGFTVQPLDH